MESPGCRRGRSWMIGRAVAFLPCLLLAGWVTPAQSKVVTYGIGLKSCETYLAAKDQESRDQLAFIDWVSGYVSGVNALSTRVNNLLGDSNLQGTIYWLDTFCRKHVKTSVAVALDLLAAVSRSTTARTTVEVITYGVGFKSCSTYIEARQQQGADESAFTEEAPFMDWFAGYVSGVDAFSLGTDNALRGSDLTGAILWLDNYCQAHPAMRFAAAVDVRLTTVPAVTAGVEKSR